jgi:heme A synthase
MNVVNTDRRFVVTCLAVGLLVAVAVWAIGLSEWQAWLSAAVLALALCTLYTVRVILPHARPRVPRDRHDRHDRPQPASR